MTSLDELIAQIPLRHNLISYVMFTGVLVGFIFRHPDFYLAI